MKYAAIATALTISATGILLDDVTTFIGLSRGFMETNPIFPLSLLAMPISYVLFLLGLEITRIKIIPQEFNRHFIMLMFFVAAFTFTGFFNNILVLLGVWT